MTGCFLVLLAGLSAIFFLSLVWIGLDPTPWLVLSAAIAAVGVGLVSYRWLRTLLPIAALTGLASAAFWAWAWTEAEGVGGLFPIFIGLSLGATALASATWRLEGRKP